MKPPPGTVEGGTDAALQTAMATTLFHWTLHPWAIYAVVGIAIAYGTFRRGRPQLISSAFAPLIGKRTEGPIGKMIDSLAIFATLFGSAASLGLGALQIGSGVRILGWLDKTGNAVLVGIIAVLTAAFVASAVSGVAKGIQWLSNINMVLAVVLAGFVFVVGPTVLILNLVPTAIGDYLRDLAEMAARTEASGGDAMATWLAGWTVFYWAWWISWTPFVGMFIARISRGRTIRQFVTGVLLVPSLVSLVWFCIFGGAAIDTQRDGVDIAGQSTPEGQLFGLLDHYPLASVTTILVVALVAIFFVSGADAASIVMGTLSQRGCHRAPQACRHLLGCADWSGRRRDAAGRRRWREGFAGSAESNDRRGTPLRPGDGRPGGGTGQGPPHRPTDVPQGDRYRGSGGSRHRRRHHPRRRLLVGRHRQRRGRSTTEGLVLRPHRASSVGSPPTRSREKSWSRSRSHSSRRPRCASTGVVC